MKISRGGWSGLASGISPCFGSLELRGGMVCFPLVLARAVCILKEGWGGRGGGGWLQGCVLSVLFCFNNSWGAVVGDGGGVSWGAKPGHG